MILWLQGNGNKFYDVIFQGISYVVSWIGALFLFVVIIIFVNKKYGIFFGICFLITIGLNYLLKIIVHRPRPYVSNPDIINKLTTLGYSFPSGHMVSVTFIILTVILLFYIQNKQNKFKLWQKTWFKTLFFVFASILILLTAIARMYLGQHYLSDIIGGIMLSFAMFFISLLVYLKMVKKQSM